jgi:hypothetical protein
MGIGDIVGTGETVSVSLQTGCSNGPPQPAPLDWEEQKGDK